MPNLYIKDDGRNPTASFKDRASAIAVVKVRELGREIITTASSGNAGAALAGMAASVGQPAVIFVPQTAPEAKVAQLLMFGASVLLVKGSYDDAFDLCLEASREFGWYCRNTGYNPFTLEGKKTAALEICEQLKWKAPDRIFVSVGDGNIISGMHKGLKDLDELGWIDKMPRLMGVQAAGAAACYNAWRHHTEKITPVERRHDCRQHQRGTAARWRARGARGIADGRSVPHRDRRRNPGRDARAGAAGGRVLPSRPAPPPMPGWSRRSNAAWWNATRPSSCSSPATG